MKNYFRKLNDKERSAFFAKLSLIAYEDPDTAVPQFGHYGFTTKYLNKDSADVYVLTSKTDIIIVCRGTEVKQLKDLKTDLQAWPKRSSHSTKGYLHFGFGKYVNKLWTEISKIIIQSNDKDIWFTGHSLGAAMASIMAIFCQANPLLKDPIGLYTFGSPRVGTKSFIEQGKNIYHERWVNNIDVVTSVPFWALGYRHFGKMMYLNHWGNYRPVTPMQHIKDRWRGFSRGLKEKKANHFANHSMAAYLQNIERWRDDLENPQE